MAFAIENFYLDRASFNTSTQIKTFAMHRYINLDDSIADIETFDYFPPFFGCDNISIKQNDYLQVQSSDSFGNLYRITYDDFGFVSLTGISQTISNYTLNSRVLNISNGQPPDYTLYFYKQSIFVTAYFPFFSFYSTSVTGVARIADSIPLAFSPANDTEIKAPIIVNDQGVLTYTGMARIHQGTITIGPIDYGGNPIKFAGNQPTWYPIFTTWITN